MARMPDTLLTSDDVDTVPERINLLGVGVQRLTRAQALARIEAFVREGRPRRVSTVNLDYLRLAGEQPVFQRALATADLAVADGMPLVWATSLARCRLPERVAGVDLVEAICDRAAVLGWRLFLLGAAPGVAVAAAEAWSERYPSLNIVGAYSPPQGDFSDDEQLYIEERIAAAAPDVLLVALGAPRQDLWLSANLERLGVPVSIGVGCTFDIASGKARRAPAWMQRHGLEWFYRLLREPSRLGRRYLIADLPVFLRLIVSMTWGQSRTVAASHPDEPLSAPSAAPTQEV